MPAIEAPAPLSLGVHLMVAMLSATPIMLQLRGFEALVAVVLLMAEAELAHSPDLREIAIEAYEILQGHLCDAPELAAVYPYLFTSIDTMLPRWVSLGLNRCVEVRMRWQDQHWARQSPVSDLRFPWLMQQLDCGLQPNPDHIRIVKKLLREGSASQVPLFR